MKKPTIVEYPYHSTVHSMMPNTRRVNFSYKRHVRRNPPLPTEHEDQCAVVEWWSLVCHKYGLPPWSLFAIPNGAKLPWSRNAKGERFSAEANRLKAEGLQPGVPDLMLAVPIKGFPVGIDTDHREMVSAGLFIEMKRPPNKPSADQEKVILYLRQRGYHVCMCWSFEEAKRAIQGYLG